jgi:tRNA(fMet)-specific endonuclease VapC
LTARYLLDTNILSAAIRDPHGHVAQRLRRQVDEICTSIIVAAELRFGAANKGSARLSQLVELLLGSIEVLPFDQPADQIYGVVRADLTKRGRRIGHLDELIATHALAENCVLVTDNERDFMQVDGLRMENWLR